MRGEVTQNFDAFSHNDTVLHIHDLPQIYSRPSFETLSETLDLLKLQPASFSSSERDDAAQKVREEGVPRYLTSIISSSLSWLRDDSQREQIWDRASARLSERSGRKAMPSMTRSFHIRDDLVINLFEPSLTEDNLGLKTWTSSLLLAKRLPQFYHALPPRCSRVLELGSGTGLVGIAAAALWGVSVTLTDLPEIIPNLQRNVNSNKDVLKDESVKLDVKPLDWSNASDVPRADSERFSLIVAADPIYSSEHPVMLVDTIARWMNVQEGAIFIVELPLRLGYRQEREDLRERLSAISMCIVEEGTEVGYDDWQGSDGRPVEVECWWSVWKLCITT